MPSLLLPYRSPFDWLGLLGFLRPRALPGAEVVSDARYGRTLRIEGLTGILALAHEPGESALRLTVSEALAPSIDAIARLARQFTDLEADPVAIDSILSEDPLLAPLVERRPGVRVPGAWNGFELAVRAILGQQVTVRGATTLAGRLIREWGEPLPGQAGLEGLTHLFPSPDRLARAPIATIGLPKARGAAIRSLAAACASGEIDLDVGLDLGLRVTTDRAAAMQSLGALRGVGDWTVQYIAMRALGVRDALPSSDLGLLKEMAHRVGTTEVPTPAVLRRASERWRPWRSYAAMHLWHALAEREDSRR